MKLVHFSLFKDVKRPKLEVKDRQWRHQHPSLLLNGIYFVLKQLIKCLYQTVSNVRRMNEDVSLVEFADGIIESTSVISGVEITGVADSHGGRYQLKDRVWMVRHRQPIFQIAQLPFKKKLNWYLIIKWFIFDCLRWNITLRKNRAASFCRCVAVSVGLPPLLGRVQVTFNPLSMRTVQVRMKSSPDLTNNSGTTCWPKRRKKFQHIFWSVIKVWSSVDRGFMFDVLSFGLSL